VISTGTLVAPDFAVSTASIAGSAITPARESTSAFTRLVSRSLTEPFPRRSERSWSWPRFLLRFPESSLFLEKPERRGSYLDSIVPLEKGLESEYFSRSETGIQNSLKLATHCCLSTASCISRGGQREGTYFTACDSLERCELVRIGK